MNTSNEREEIKMDNITVEIKEELELETVIDDNALDRIAEFFIDEIITPYIEDEYVYTPIVGEAMINELSNISYNDINIGMAKAIIKYLIKKKRGRQNGN